MARSVLDRRSPVFHVVTMVGFFFPKSAATRRRRRLLLYVGLLLIFAGPAAVLATGRVQVGGEWYQATNRSSGILPAPSAHRPAELLVFGARLFGVRGSVAIHTWVVAKRTGADRWSRYEVIGWRARAGRSALAVNSRTADSYWFGNRPFLIARLSGPTVDALIDRIERRIDAYPHRDRYTLWPGPNSNTFTAWLGQQVPELALDLPVTAVGKDFPADGAVLGPAVSGTGLRLTLMGLGGLTLAWEEGLEINLLGVGVGVDPLDMAVEMPGIGRFAVFD